jgi:hypothetical protein
VFASQVAMACAVGVSISFFGFRAKALLAPTDAMVRFAFRLEGPKGQDFVLPARVASFEECACPVHA